MASEAIGADDFTEKQRWGEISKVYTRKYRNKRLKNSAKDAVSTVTAVNSAVSVAAEVVTKGNGKINGDSRNNKEKDSVENCDTDVVPENLQAIGLENGNSSPRELQNLQALGFENGNSPPRELHPEQDFSQLNGILDVHNPVPGLVVEVENGNGEIKKVVTRIDDKVIINLGATKSKEEFRELTKKIVSELDQVRNLVKELEAKEIELSNSVTTAPIMSGPLVVSAPIVVPLLPPTVYSQSQLSGDDVIERRALTRVHSEVGPMSRLESRPFRPVSVPVMESNDFGDRRVLLRRNSEAGFLVGHDRRALMRVNSEVGGQDYRPFRQLSVSVVDNSNHVYGNGEFVEKEKRTPKANQFYRNSEFLLGKDRLPPESNKKAKSNGGRKHGGSMGYGFGMDKHRNQAFKNCGHLLQRLMKHKHGWVFNEPVNAMLLGLHDYHDIITHPMDLGTIKNKLAQNMYKSPVEFAEDVRLTFSNAMTYNPPGQDVHVMAAQLSEIFEEKWAAIESEYNHEWRYEMMHYAGLQTPSSRKGPPPAHLSMRAFDRSVSMSAPGDPRLRPSIAPVSRTPVPKKPKAKDPNKRDMTYEEKQKLSTNLQSLPSEKLDNIVQIIKKRNSTLSQHDDEIEVDIDSVDVETLWELDRLVTNYKKSLSKNRRKAEIAQARAEATHNISALNPVPLVTTPLKESDRGEMNGVTGAPIPDGKQHDNISRSSSSSSSSSSDSGSSSSDSDSDSSSADGSDAGHSPRS